MIQNLTLRVIVFVVLLQTFYCPSFYSDGKTFFLGFPLANVDLSIDPTRSDTPVFMKQVFLLVKKLSIQIGLILLKHVGSDIRVQSLWSAINSLNFGLFGVILKSPMSKILSYIEQ